MALLPPPLSLLLPFLLNHRNRGPAARKQGGGEEGAERFETELCKFIYITTRWQGKETITLSQKTHCMKPRPLVLLTAFPRVKRPF